MLVTHELLKSHQACPAWLELFAAEYPDGLEPTVENAIVAASAGFDVIWCIRLLPLIGPGSQIAFALWCAEQVAHLTTDPRIATCLAIVAAEVANPGSQDMAAIKAVMRGAEAVVRVAWTIEAAARAAAADTNAAWAAWAAASAAEAAARAAAADAAAAVAEAAVAGAAVAGAAVAGAAVAATRAVAAKAAWAVKAAWTTEAASPNGPAARDAQIAMLAQMLSNV